MNKRLEEILHQITALSKDERTELLQVLQEQIEPPISVAEFAQLIQRMYKKNISIIYHSEPIGLSSGMKAIVTTPYGEFSAVGRSKITAKDLAIQEAFKEFNKQTTLTKND